MDHSPQLLILDPCQLSILEIVSLRNKSHLIIRHKYYKHISIIMEEIINSYTAISKGRGRHLLRTGETC